MKSLYIIPFLALSISMYAQERTTSEQIEDQEQIVKQAKERQLQLLKSLEENAPPKQAPNTLVSEQGLKANTQESKSQPSISTSNTSGKLLPSTASFEEMLSTIPNRQKTRKVSADSRNTNNNVAGLPNTATLEEIKRTIPKN
ncbi:hypothetical protein CHRYSEOSP005_01800 [Chryseobacterium sp. Alg-005]|uniref:hypothetical protein n=1 Tax=Chryseobacterium sp. Alg-005 TaxID=3159516 RepID=UPI0035557AB0